MLLKGQIESKFPFEKLKNIKFEFDEKVLDQHDESGKLEYVKTKILTYNDDKKLQWDLDYKESGIKNFESLAKYEYKFFQSFKILDKPLLSMSDEYNHDLTGDLKKVHEKGYIKYGDKEVTGEADLQWQSDLSKVSLTGKFTTPFEKLKTIDVKADHKVRFTHLKENS